MGGKPYKLDGFAHHRIFHDSTHHKIPAIALEFIKPAKPAQNLYIEGFNRTYRTEIQNMYLVKTLNEVRYLTENWITGYNEERLHNVQNNLTP